MQWRRVGVYVLGAAALGAVLLFQGLPVKQLPFWLVGFVVLSWGTSRLHAIWRRHSRSVDISSVSIEREMLVVSRPGQSLRARQLVDGAECAATSVPRDASAHAVAFEENVSYGDVARLWLAGDDKSDLRRTLRGLQPAPATPIVLLRPELVITKGWRTSPPEPLPILVVHLVALDDHRSEQLTKISLAGAIEWTVKFADPMVRRARWMFVTTELVVFVLGSPWEAVALRISTGDVAWRVAL